MGITQSVADAELLSATLGRVLRQRRLASGLTFVDIVERTRLPLKRVDAIERNTGGAGNIRLATLFALAGALDLTPTDLVARIESAVVAASEADLAPARDVTCCAVSGDWKPWAKQQVGLGVVRAPITYGAWERSTRGRALTEQRSAPSCR